MRFGKSMGNLLRGRLYEVWEVYGDPRGSLRSYMRSLGNVWGS